MYAKEMRHASATAHAPYRPHPAPVTLLSVLEENAVGMLRDRRNTAVAMRDRLNARHYLMSVKGWTAEQVNAARDAEETPPSLPVTVTR